jgi:hypothetical protein
MPSAQLAAGLLVEGLDDIGDAGAIEHAELSAT